VPFALAHDPWSEDEDEVEDEEEAEPVAQPARVVAATSAVAARAPMRAERDRSMGVDLPGSCTHTVGVARVSVER
jgi:hypothetical protein